MASREKKKMDSNLELAELKKDGDGKAISLLKLQWNDLHSHLDSSQSYLEERFTQLQSRECYLEERFTQLQSREKRLISVQESVADSNKHLDSIRQSLEKRAKEIENKHHEFRAFQKQHINELKLKEKQLDRIRKSVEGSIKEMEVREEKLVAHQRSIEGFFEKLDLEMKQFQNIQRSSGERLGEINRKEMQLESTEALLQSARKCINDALESCSNGKKRKQQSEGESEKKHKISGSCPQEQVESRTATEKMSKPEKADFQSETTELRRSRAEFPTTPGPGHSNGAKEERHSEFTFSKGEKTKQKVDSNTNNELRRSQAGFPTTPGPGHSNGAKVERHGEFTFSKDGKTKLKVESSPNKVSEEVFFHDFTLERSWEKFQTGQIWAMYENGLPNRYVRIKSTTPYSQGLHVQSVGPHTTSYRCGSGRFSVQDGNEFYSQSPFSHMVKAQSISKIFIEIYPKKGQIWAILTNWNSHLSRSYSIVEVLEDTGQPRKVSPLVRVSGFKSVFRPALVQGSTTGVFVRPWAELSRFSHQIPAFQLTAEKEGKLRSYWELDPAAVPGLKLPLSTAPNT